MSHTKTAKITVVVFAVLIAGGCATAKKVGMAPVRAADAVHDAWAGQPKVSKRDRQLDQAGTVEPPASAPTLDSHASLVSDHRAAGVGQSVTVVVIERASSSTSADTRTRSSLDAGGRFDKTLRFDEGSVEFDGRSVGAGSINREGEFIASVSAVVTEVLPGGELVIFGEQTIEVNDETQYIRVYGRIRPEDISGNNTVLSTRMAGAEITYKGYGVLAETQEPGFLTRIFNWVF